MGIVMGKWQESVLALGLVAWLAMPVVAQDSMQLDELEDLKRRVAELELDQGGGTSSSSIFSKLGSMFQVYGYIRLDAIYDDSEPNDNQVPSFIRSEDEATGQQENDDSFNMHARLTRLGLDFVGPDNDWGFDLTGKVEIDFYAFPDSDSRAEIRMRKAYVKIGTDDWAIQAGQDNDLFSPLVPSVNADLLNWNAGNTGDRRAQLRFSYTPKVGEARLRAEVALAQPGAIDGKNFNVILPPDGVTDGEDSGMPQLQVRLGADIPIWEDHPMKVGIWTVQGREETDERVGTFGRNDFDVELYGVDAVIPFWEDKIWVQAEYWFGENMSDLRGGIGQGINTVTGREIEGQGGWAELGFKTADWQTFYVGYSFDNPDHEDLPFSITNPSRDQNKLFYFATKNTLWNPITFGFEYIHWETEYVGLEEGDDNRFKVYFQYDF